MPYILLYYLENSRKDKIITILTLSTLPVLQITGVVCTINIYYIHTLKCEKRIQFILFLNLAIKCWFVRNWLF